ncbi:arabinogalactan endo-1,4-beta-galactosidase [Guyanagaster necrorhizus]|uniref:Arabinogalactan endo-beta-1,4-galactanase n=1 Tax=Guyanagaster necrorhizus TaxID=856835 RepID=A0A9P7VZN5_9AGAR|nr:arabinogalactan endo-1,4-beta-galactosidase [Guyanagaster necrorhizus MCA 3950]KAG7449528.1 arabinogalactan endo-1,4-beta-galactosidase [Guyanagaster necrorhizus MCA 3950]
MAFLLILWLLVLAPFLRVHSLDYYGADFSSLVNLERSGISYSDGGSKKAFEDILADHGANIARIRIWTSESDSEYSLDYGLALARRVVDAGMALLIDLHYSDTWADPSKQAIPSAWSEDLNSLNTEIWQYTLDLVNAFNDQGTPIDFIQIGNEINGGFLWPTGQVSVNGYEPLSELLHSAVSAVRQASSSTKTVIHLANGWDKDSILYFYEQVFDFQGDLELDDIDVMAFSMYPFYDSGATLSALQSSLKTVVSTYSKDVMIVETDWPVQCSGVDLTENIAVSVQGQETWMSDLEDIVNGLSGGHGIGLFYWEPGWIGNAGLGSNCSDNLLVDSSGKTRDSIDIFAS